MCDSELYRGLMGLKLSCYPCCPVILLSRSDGRDETLWSIRNEMSLESICKGIKMSPHHALVMDAHVVFNTNSPSGIYSSNYPHLVSLASLFFFSTQKQLAWSYFT
ncbi:hypothetical protein BRADI_2g02868v3 [Brachypodium distachyon]|uniref:Uncharacterized protein n=1 Tax=Brachypodium distachyon TaxID=15368 RepID=A0A2K2D6K9_BRADI|nr:hypothetical protein BRADI_2g02868v3 [Brachypodium distachyon]